MIQLTLGKSFGLEGDYSRSFKRIRNETPSLRISKFLFNSYSKLKSELIVVDIFDKNNWEDAI